MGTRKANSNQNCSVPQCDAVRKKNPNLSFHRFPSDQPQFIRWKNRVKIKKVGTSAAVCSRHFRPSDFCLHPPNVPVSRRRLRKGVIPSQNIPRYQFDKGQPTQSKDKRRKRMWSPASEQDPDAKRVPKDVLPSKNLSLHSNAQQAPPPEVPTGAARKARATHEAAANTADVPHDECAASAVPKAMFMLHVKEVGRGITCTDDHLYNQQFSVTQPEDRPGEPGEVPQPPPPPSDGGTRRDTHGSVRVRRLSVGDSMFSPPAPPPPPLPSPPTAPPPLQLPKGRLLRHLVDMKAKRQQLHNLQKIYNSLVDRVQFRSAHSDWTEKVHEPPLLTLRNRREEREPPLVPIDSLSADIVMPLTPNDAWHAVALLRQEVLDVQLALMHTRIVVLGGELRLQEADAVHRRYKANVIAERRQAEQRLKMGVLKMEKRGHLSCTACPQWRRKLRVLEKRLGQTFTPMQMRVIRTGKRPRWTEEDLRRAIKLKKCVGNRGYGYIRSGMNIPLPTPVILGRGVERFESLKPLYDKMMVANEQKTKKLKPGDGGYSPTVRKRKGDAFPHRLGVESFAVERPLVKRRKKRPPALSSPPPPDLYESESLSQSAAEEVVRTGTTAATPHLDRVAGADGKARPARPSWTQRAHRLRDEDEQSMDEKTLEKLTRPRDPRGWSSGATGLR